MPKLKFNLQWFLGEAKRDANKARIFLGLMREPEVPDTDDVDEIDDEPKKKKKAKAPTFRKTRRGFYFNEI